MAVSVRPADGSIPGTWLASAVPAACIKCQLSLPLPAQQRFRSGRIRGSRRPVVINVALRASAWSLVSVNAAVGNWVTRTVGCGSALSLAARLTALPPPAHRPTTAHRPAGRLGGSASATGTLFIVLTHT